MLRLPPVAQCLCLRDEIGEGRVGDGGGDGGVEEEEEAGRR